MMKDKVILVDVDGVLLDWEYHFYSWLKETYPLRYDVLSETSYKTYEKIGEYKDSRSFEIGELTPITKDVGRNLAREFNESAQVRYMSPLRDAIAGVKFLNERHGFVFHAITSLSDKTNAQRLRTENLEELFGKVFEKFVYLDTGADKNEVLEPYRDSGCYWIEDKPENVDVGISMGLKGILMAHDHNADYEGDAIRVKNWSGVNSVLDKWSHY
jgi:FMN phosphatase YigB (HAD superfamily)